MPSGHGHTPKESFCIENVLPGEVASEELDDKGKIAFRELYSRMVLICYIIQYLLCLRRTREMPRSLRLLDLPQIHSSQILSLKVELNIISQGIDTKDECL